MTAPVDFAALPSALVVPGLNQLLGTALRKATDAPEEDLDAYCARITKPNTAGRAYRIRIAADGQVTEVAS